MVIYCHEKLEGHCGVSGFAHVGLAACTKSGGCFSSHWAKPCSTSKDGTSTLPAVDNHYFNLFYEAGYFCIPFLSNNFLGIQCFGGRGTDLAFVKWMCSKIPVVWKKKSKKPCFFTLPCGRCTRMNIQVYTRVSSAPYPATWLSAGNCFPCLPAGTVGAALAKTGAGSCQEAFWKPVYFGCFPSVR